MDPRQIPSTKVERDAKVDAKQANFNAAIAFDQMRYELHGEIATVRLESDEYKRKLIQAKEDLKALLAENRQLKEKNQEQQAELLRLKQIEKRLLASKDNYKEKTKALNASNQKLTLILRKVLKRPLTVKEAINLSPTTLELLAPTALVSIAISASVIDIAAAPAAAAAIDPAPASASAIDPGPAAASAAAIDPGPAAASASAIDPGPAAASASVIDPAPAAAASASSSAPRRPAAAAAAAANDLEDGELPPESPTSPAKKKLKTGPSSAVPNISPAISLTNQTGPQLFKRKPKIRIISVTDVSRTNKNQKT